MSRRTLLAKAGLAAFAGATFRSGAAPGRIARLEQTIGGRIGVAAWNTGSGARVAGRGDERFAMCSTFKWMLAAAILARSDAGLIRLDRHIAYTKADLLPHSPITQAHLHDGAMTVASLCEAAVVVSDNGAANLLLHQLGGPAALTAWLRSTGDGVTRLDRFELALNENLPGDPRDTTTPNAQLATMNRILLGHVLAEASRLRLVQWMIRCETGLDRLRAGLPHGWIVADKTGTGTGSGPTSASNDLAVAWSPGRAPILVASYICGSPAPAERLNAAHAMIGRIIASI